MKRTRTFLASQTSVKSTDVARRWQACLGSWKSTVRLWVVPQKLDSPEDITKPSTLRSGLRLPLPLTQLPTRTAHCLLQGELQRGGQGAGAMDTGIWGKHSETIPNVSPAQKHESF